MRLGRVDNRSVWAPWAPTRGTTLRRGQVTSGEGTVTASMPAPAMERPLVDPKCGNVLNALQWWAILHWVRRHLDSSTGHVDVFEGCGHHVYILQEHSFFLSGSVDNR